MLRSVQGIYRKGKIELKERPEDLNDDTLVIVTFLESSPVDLRARGIDEPTAAELRARLAPFAEDWNSPEMEVYDNYESVKSNS
jgi:hypothetical protein